MDLAERSHASVLETVGQIRIYAYGAYNDNGDGAGSLRKGTFNIQRVQDGFVQGDDPSKGFGGDSGGVWLIPFDGGAIDRTLDQYVIAGVESFGRRSTWVQDTDFGTLNTEIAT